MVNAELISFLLPKLLTLFLRACSVLCITILHTVLQYAYWDDKLKKLPFSHLSQSWLKQVVSKGKPVYQDGSGAIHTDKSKGMPLFYVDAEGEAETETIEADL